MVKSPGTNQDCKHVTIAWQLKKLKHMTVNYFIHNFAYQTYERYWPIITYKRTTSGTHLLVSIYQGKYLVIR